VATNFLIVVVSWYLDFLLYERYGATLLGFGTMVQFVLRRNCAKKRKDFFFVLGLKMKLFFFIILFSLIYFIIILFLSWWYIMTLTIYLTIYHSWINPFCSLLGK
jgi:hypothetical protein